MTDEIASAPKSTLAGRSPAASVITRTLAEQSWAPHRSLIARVFGVNPLAGEARSWYAGALGELRVGERLSSLGPEWTVLHSVPIGRGESDIDHVAIGPAGVFTLNTKHLDEARVWVGERAMLVNGQKTDYLRNARYERDRVERLLRDALGVDVPVFSAIVVVGAKEWTFRQRPSDVAVLRESELLRWLRKRRDTSVDEASVAAVAVRPETWHVNGADMLVEADPVAFADLRAEVNRAALVRGSWLLTVGAAALWAAWTVLSPAIGL